MSVTTAAAPPLDAPPGWWRFRQWPGRLFDFGVVLALLAVGAAIVVTTTGEIPRLSSAKAPVFVVLLIPLASLLLRRRRPLLTIGIIAVGMVAVALLRPPALIEPLVMVAVYIAASRLPWRLSLLISVALYALFVASAFLSGSFSASTPIQAFVPMAAAYAVGVYVGTRVAYIEALRSRAVQLERERELLAQQAVAEERVRIARELHDVVAHHLSLITVQAGALQAQVEAGSAPATTAGVIASTGHQAMDEMRRMLGVLRLGAPDESPDHEPQPGVADIERLVAQTRAAGVETTLRVEGERVPLPPGVELSAYRIVQEALTNVLRHAGPARCTVQISYGAGALELRVTDDGRGASAAPVSRGHGLVGMRERVALFGGDLFAGAVPGGGFAVRATLPLTNASVRR